MVYASVKIKLYESLGQIIVSFGALERGVDRLILAGINSPLSWELTSLNSMTFQQKIPLMNTLIRNLHSVQELGILDQTLQVLTERCLMCQQERNSWIYSYWVPEIAQTDGFVSRLQNEEDSAGLILTTVEISELENFVVVLNATVAYLYGFHQKLSNKFGRVRTIRSIEDFLKRYGSVVQDS
jgi:hypothetical protein